MGWPAMEARTVMAAPTPPPGFELIDQPQGVPQPPPGFQVIDSSPVQNAAQSMSAADASFAPQRRQPELRAYEPTWRDRLAQMLMPDERASPLRERSVEALLGSRGLGRTGTIPAVDFTPAGIVLAGDEMMRAQEEGDVLGTAVNAAAMIPAPGVAPAVRAARSAFPAVAPEIVRDVRAFQNLGVRPFGPAFNEGPTASVARQLAETPVVGAPIRSAFEESLTGARDAAENIASQIGQRRERDEIGATLQSGLERFRGAGLDDLEPGVVQGMGINPNAPVQRPRVMSAGAAQQAQQAAPIRQQIGADVTQTTRGATVPAGQPLEQTLIARTRVEDVSDAELTRIIRSSSRDTSFGTRSEALYERAWRHIPDLRRADNSVNPNMIAAVNTRQALGSVDRSIANQIAGQGTISGALAERLRNPQAANFTLADLRAIRTEVGRSLSNTNPLQATLSGSQLRHLYGSISRDIEIGLETIANRAALLTQQGHNQANRATVEQARRAAGALRAFRTADRYFRQGMARIERFHQILNAQNHEQAAKRLVSAALNQGRGNIGMLRAAHAALRPEEWADVSAMVLRELGQPVGSARGMTQEIGFSVSSFMTRWQNMDPRARALLFGGEHARAIDDLMRVVNRLANVEATYNTSRSATNAINLGGLLGTGAAVAGGADAMFTAGAAALTGLTASVLMSRPQYVRWLARYAQLRAALTRGVPPPGQVNAQAALRAHVGRLGEMAKSDPQLLEALRSIGYPNIRGEHENGPDEPESGDGRQMVR